MRNSARHSVLFFAGIASALCIAALGTTVYNIFSPGGALSGTWNSQNVNLAAGSSFILNQLPVTAGGTGGATATAARGNLLAAASGANSDITSLSGLATPLSVPQGGSGVATLTGLALGNGASAFSAYGGTSCTNKFPRSLSAAGAAACASVSLSADVTGTLPVTAGGTNAGTLTAHGVLLGEGTSTVSAVSAMAADTLLQGQGVTADPAAVSVVNCGSGSQALAYSTGTHTFSCQSLSTANITPDTHPTSPTTFDDEFETGSTINTGLWTWVNQGGATGPLSQGSLTLIAPASGTDNQRSVEQTIPAGAWGFSAKVTVLSSASYYIGGLIVRVSGTDKRIIFAFSQNTGYKLEVAGYTNATTYGGFLPVSAADTTAATYGIITTAKYFRITYDGVTTWTFSLSVSGVEGTYISVYSANINTAFLGAAPDRIGIVGDSRTTTTAVAVDWFRRTS